MVAPAVIYAGVAAASAIYGGISSSQNSKSNAQAAQAAALQNAINVRQAGVYNATLAGMAGMINARNTLAMASLSAQSSLLVASYNEALTRSVVDYNVSLLEAELPALLEAWQLSDLQLDQQRARSTGSIIATQGASGTVIGEGSNADTIISNEAAFALDAAILRHNFDQQATDVMNAISRSQWEGEAQIAKMNYEAKIGAYTTMAQANLNASAIRVNTGLNMLGTMYNANSQANTIMSQGNAQHQQGMNTANQQLSSGIIQGIGAAAETYSKSALLNRNPAGSPGQNTVLNPGPSAVNYQPYSPGTSLMVA